jgi:hypothetical protein
MKTSKAWSEADHRQLCAMVDEGKSWEEIGAAVDRTPIACEAHYRRGFRGREPRLRRHAFDAAFQARQAIAEMPPRSLTAEFFGDPLPGRSALDKRGEMQPGRAISLAGMP